MHYRDLKNNKELILIRRGRDNKTRMLKSIGVNGFTLVELLVVISLLIVLSAVLISVINPKVQRAKAEDSIRQANLEKLVLGIESYANIHGLYPTTDDMENLDTGGVPVNPDVGLVISRVPNNEPTQGVTYYYHVDPDRKTFGTYVSKSSSPTSCYKYRSYWGKIKECSGESCTGGTNECI